MMSMRPRMSREGCMSRPTVCKWDEGTIDGKERREGAPVHAGYFLERERNRLAALRRIDHSHCHLLAFSQMRNAGRPEHGNVHENIFPAIVAGDETKPLGVVEPLHLSDDRDRGRGIRGDAARRPDSIARRPLLWSLDNSGGVDFDHSRHLRALGAGADLDAKFRAGGNGLMTRGVQRIGVQERVARAARQLDESVALVRLEPFDDRIDSRCARVDGRGWAAARWAAKTAPLRASAKAPRRARP